MKRRDLIKHLTDKGCVLLREGGKYSVYQNPVTQKEVPITRPRPNVIPAAMDVIDLAAYGEPDF